VTPELVGVGAGCHGFDPERLTRFRQAVADPASGAELAQLGARLETAGYQLGSGALKRPPPGFSGGGQAGRRRSPARCPLQLGQEHTDRWTVVGALRPRPSDHSGGVHHEVTAQLQRVAAWPVQPLPAREQARIPRPHPRVEPHGVDPSPPQPPGAVGDPLGVDQHRPGQLEGVEQPVADPPRRVVDHEHRRPADPGEPIAVLEHLHEVRAADQSPRVAQERDQHRLAA
jgi:hypothetical protein